MGKVLAFIFFFVWLRGTLPRLRYDQFMHFGWKRLIPFTLVWIIAVAAIRTIDLNGGFDRSWLYAAIGVCVALIVVLMFVDEKKRSDADAEAEAAAREPFDAFAGGYPVPPMPSIAAGRTTVGEES
jgi:NADH-quinone oxidoreductase subunit H